jgi:hypothetical protein
MTAITQQTAIGTKRKERRFPLLILPGIALLVGVFLCGFLYYADMQHWSLPVDAFQYWEWR